jgi:ParB-like chromosome segregation protein Spo0J
MKIPEIKLPEIPIRDITIVDINKLSVDGKNPNKMDVNQCIALQNHIKEVGFIVPIVTNKDYVIADGEQRWNAARELGMKKVSVVKLDVKEVDRRFERQILNKLHGTHGKMADAMEYQWLLENDDQATNKFMQFMAQEAIDVQKIAKQLDVNTDKAMEELEKVKPKVKITVEHTCPECGCKF